MFKDRYLDPTIKSRSSMLASVKAILCIVLVLFAISAISTIAKVAALLLFALLILHPAQGIPAVLVTGFVVYKILHRNDRRRHDQELLDIPVEKLERLSLEELEKKYI